MVDTLQVVIPMAMGNEVILLPTPINTPEETVRLVTSREFLQE